VGPPRRVPSLCRWRRTPYPWSRITCPSPRPCPRARTLHRCARIRARCVGPGRSESISADDAIYSQIDEDPASRKFRFREGRLCLFSTDGVPSMGSGLSPRNVGSFLSAGVQLRSTCPLYVSASSVRAITVGIRVTHIRSPIRPPRHVGVSPTVRVRIVPVLPLPVLNLAGPSPMEECNVRSSHR